MPRFAQNPEMAACIMDAARSLPGDFQEYRHWEKVKYHKPLPPGFTPEAWWCALKVLRSATAQPLPLISVKGRPVYFTNPAGLQARLRVLSEKLGFKSGLVAESEPASEMRRKAGLFAESISSSIIEGAVTTREDAMEMLATARKPKDAGEQMVANNYKAIRYICGVADQPMTKAVLLEIQKLITEGTLERADQSGRFRVEADRTVLRSGHELIFTPPPAPELPGRLDKLIAFANGEGEADSMDPVLRAILLHFWLAYDHPFADGNGRTARALFYWSMLRSGHPLVEHISLSGAILADKASYYASFLFTQADEDDATYFVLNQVGMLESAVEHLAREVGSRKEWFASDPAVKLDKVEGLNERQRALIVQGLAEPGAVYTVEGYRALHDVTHMTAWRDLKALLRLGLLEEGEKLDKAHAFVVPANLSSRLRRAVKGRTKRK